MTRNADGVYQIYVEDEDFDEVYDFIAARYVNAKGRARRRLRKENAR